MIQTLTVAVDPLVVDALQSVSILAEAIGRRAVDMITDVLNSAQQ